MVLSFLALPAVSAGPAPRDLDMVCQSAAVNRDLTHEARDDFPLDVLAGRATGTPSPTATYYGSSRPFRSLEVDVGQAGKGGHLSWSYWTGAAWDTVPTLHTDLDHSGWQSYSFGRLTNWAARADVLPECAGSFYFLKSTTSAEYTVPPVLDQAVVHR